MCLLALHITNLENNSKQNFTKRKKHILKFEIEWNLKRTKLTSKLKLKIEKAITFPHLNKEKKRGVASI
jgi:hypothetical protein